MDVRFGESSRTNSRRRAGALLVESWSALDTQHRRRRMELGLDSWDKQVQLRIGVLPFRFLFKDVAPSLIEQVVGYGNLVPQK